MAQCRPPDKLCYRRFSIPIWAKRRKPCIQIGFQRAPYAIASPECDSLSRLAPRHPLGICAPSV